MTITSEPEQAGRTAPDLLWLDLTRKCRLGCVHCYNDSGPSGDHGTMTRDDWARVLDQAAAYGVSRVQLIGGEPTLHPHAADLVECALRLGLSVELYTNLVHISATWWGLFRRAGVSVATSYYSNDPDEHNATTGRPSHARTRATIISAVQLGVPVFAGIVDTGDYERADRARRELEALGVTGIRVDQARPFGRAAHGRPPEPSGLCGRCGTGRAAVGPDGQVSPCPMSAMLGVGNVHTAELADILGGAAMTEATTAIRASVPVVTDCDPDGECSPGYGDSGGSPRT